MLVPQKYMSILQTHEIKKTGRGAGWLGIP